MSNIAYPVTLNEPTILGLKPDDLGSIEPELQAPPFRIQEWHVASPTIMKILNEWLAIRGWVCQRLEEPDYEGPHHHLIIAYQFDGKLYQKYSNLGYDTYHWAVSYPEHYSWFHRTLNPGHPLTLLINPEDHGEVMIFGQCEVFAKRNGKLEWCAK